MTWNSGTTSSDAAARRARPRGGGVAAHRARDAEHDDVLQVRDHLAVRERRALRLPGRARRVEDREQVVLVDRRLRQPGSPSPATSSGTARRDVAGRRRSRTRARARGSPASRSRDDRRCRRASQISTFASESARPNSSSSAFHHAFSGTSDAPSIAHAQNVTTHSGTFAEHERDAVAAPTPSSASDAASTRASAVVLAEREAARSPCTTEVDVGARALLRHELAQRAHALLVDLRRDAERRPRRRSRTGRRGR